MKIVELLNHTFNILVVFFCSVFAFGQSNLILNGDFEEYWECPNDVTQIERCKYVYNPLPNYSLNAFYSTPDYFNVCSQQANVPEIIGGYQNAYSGNGFTGFYNFDNQASNFFYREYIQLSFSEELECGKKYTFRGYFNVGNEFRYTLKDIGFYFSQNELEEQDYLYNLYKPQYVDETTLIDDTANWTLLTFDFVADKNYRFVTIGHYSKDGTNSFVEINPNANNPNLETYIVIDSVSLVAKNETPLVFPNVFTPNGDNINDLFTVVGDTKMFHEMQIINRWGNQVAQLHYPFEWNGESNNQETPDGLYYYVMVFNEGCKNKKYQGMIQLTR